MDPGGWTYGKHDAGWLVWYQ
ncbi:hypothetical protein ALC53_02113 [Atta colombica]|uniref:Uncharacterized protein n=1 Tax=Atta colombica TaxID=520822 RepID=A0A195BTP3_9HYME|nr:hypothetical protein ALC53_02113 [Atta colombica]